MLPLMGFGYIEESDRMHSAQTFYQLNHLPKGIIMKKAVCFIVAITVPMIFAGCGSSSSASPTTAKPAHSQMYYWVHNGGSNSIQTIGLDMVAIGSADKATCATLQADAKKAQAGPAMPDKTIDNNYQLFLTDANSAAQACLAGDYNLQAQYITSATNAMDTVASQFKALPQQHN